MKFEKMRDVPNTRSEFERNLNILRERAKNGKLKFPSKDFPAIESLLKTRDLPNGRWDFLSVDELARLMANTAVNLQIFDQKTD